MSPNEITYSIIGAAMKVHERLGPGLLENAYVECLSYELKKGNLVLEKEKPLKLVYDEVQLDCGYRLDFVVNGQVVLEVKSVDALHDVHLAQLLTYLRVGNYKLGLLINFN